MIRKAFILSLLLASPASAQNFIKTSGWTDADVDNALTITGGTITGSAISTGTINNTPIGATTATTGAFTTLGASGKTTLGGTNLASNMLDVFTNSAGTIAAFQNNAAANGNIMVSAINGNSATGTVIGFKAGLQSTGTAMILVQQGGTGYAELQALTTSTGDPKTTYVVNAVTTVSTGLDNSDSDKYKISFNADLGTSVAVSVDPATLATTLAGQSRVVSALTTGTTLTASQAYSQVYTNTGASGAIVHNLPAAVAGMRVMFYVSAAQDVDINPDNADQILGLTNAVGDAISSDATIGSRVELTAIDSVNWAVTESNGTWTDVN